MRAHLAVRVGGEGERMEFRQPGRFGVRLVEDGDSRGGEVRAGQGQPVSGAEVFHRLGEASEGAGGGEVDDCYPLGETVPVHKAMGGDWAEVVHRTDKRGRRRVVRMVYEAVAFQALRDQLKCRRSGWSAPTSGATPTRTCGTVAHLS